MSTEKGPYKVENGEFIGPSKINRVVNLTETEADAVLEALNAAYVKGYAAGQEAAHPPSGAVVEARPVVRWFAEQMELQLRRNDHKGGWAGMSHSELLDRLGDEVKELNEAIEAFSPTTALRIATKADIVHEAVDVANFAMMIADNEGDRLGASSPSVEPTVDEQTERIMEVVKDWSLDISDWDESRGSDLRKRIKALLSR